MTKTKNISVCNGPKASSELKSSAMFQFKFVFNPDKCRGNCSLEAAEWRNRMEMHLSFCTNPENEKLIFLHANLDGAASLKAFEAPRDTARAFLDWFKSTYCEGVTNITVLNEFRKLKQTGSLREYIADFQRIRHYNRLLVSPIDAEAMQMEFIDGLQNAALKKALIRKKFAGSQNISVLELTINEAVRLTSCDMYEENTNSPKVKAKATPIFEKKRVHSENHHPSNQEFSRKASAAAAKMLLYETSENVYTPPHRRQLQERTNNCWREKLPSGQKRPSKSLVTPDLTDVSDASKDIDMDLCKDVNGQQSGTAPSESC
ncbi:hypothetical protein JCM33374_g3109 [Metschnikowia sp. JCM 33374]|nr:hypothetical protein JCM33374_g3109 [Metschnikowia sp. JCM 33374]